MIYAFKANNKPVLFFDLTTRSIKFNENTVSCATFTTGAVALLGIFV